VEKFILWQRICSFCGAKKKKNVFNEHQKLGRKWKKMRGKKLFNKENLVIIALRRVLKLFFCFIMIGMTSKKLLRNPLIIFNLILKDFREKNLENP
jgi:hypothetical protein